MSILSGMEITFSESGEIWTIGHCRLDTEFGSFTLFWFGSESSADGGGGVRMNSETGSSISQVPDK